MVAAVRADSPALMLSLLLGMLAPAVFGATPALNTEGIKIAADVQESNFRDDVHVLTGNVHITQADKSMEAEKATISGMQSDHKRVRFENAVHIRSALVDLRADSADTQFANGQVTQATVQGSPALFEQLNVPADKKVLGRARAIEYDFGQGTVKMTQDVWFSYGGNEFRGDTVIYNLNEQRVVVNPGATSASGGRVNITIKPGTVPDLPGSKKPAKPADGGGNE